MSGMTGKGEDMLGLLIGAAVASDLIDTIGGAIETIGEASTHIIEASNNARKDMIVANYGASHFYQKQYMEVIHTLLGMGFTNVHAVEIRKHRKGFFTQNIYGQVESVSINGNDSFQKGTRFAREAYVLVSFHVFKDSPHVVIPELEHRTRSHAGFEQPGYQPPINVNVNINNGPQPDRYQYGQRQYNGNPNHGQQRPFSSGMPAKRCAYCGVLAPQHAVFCPHCGAPF